MDPTFFFRTTSSSKIEAQTLIEHLKQDLMNKRKVISGAKVAIFYRKGEFFSEDIFNEFQLQLRDIGVSIDDRVFDLSDRKFNAETILATVNQQGVDALILLPDGRNTDSKAFNKAMNVIKANDGEVVILGSNPLYNNDIINLAGGLKNLKNILFVATDWHQMCTLDDFDKEINKYWLGGVNRATALSYEAVEVLLPMLNDGVDSKQIRQEIEGLSASGKAVPSSVFDGKTISFDGEGNRVELTDRILVKVGKNLSSPFEVSGGCP